MAEENGQSLYLVALSLVFEGVPAFRQSDRRLQGNPSLLVCVQRPRWTGP